jgi:hypothetical protein
MNARLDITKTDIRYRLDDILSQWHQWCNGYAVLGEHKTSAMFNGVRNYKQYDTEYEVNDSSLHSAQMKTVNFHVEELNPMQRTAVGMQARNLCTGRSVWSSARLPADIAQRATLLAEARNILCKKLISAGIL